MSKFSIPGLLSGVAFAAAVNAVQSPAAADVPPNAQDRCVVLMNKQKTVITAEISSPDNGSKGSATRLIRTETGYTGPFQNAQGTDLGALTVAVRPKSDDPKSSLRPETCTVDGKTYPVMLPESIEKRLFSAPGPGNT